MPSCPRDQAELLERTMQDPGMTTRLAGGLIGSYTVARGRRCLLSGVDCVLRGRDCVLRGVDCVLRGVDRVLSGVYRVLSGVNRSASRVNSLPSRLDCHDKATVLVAALDSTERRADSPLWRDELTRSLTRPYCVSSGQYSPNRGDETHIDAT